MTAVRLMTAHPRKSVPQARNTTALSARNFEALPARIACYLSRRKQGRTAACTPHNPHKSMPPDPDYPPLH